MPFGSPASSSKTDGNDALWANRDATAHPEAPAKIE